MIKDLAKFTGISCDSRTITKGMIFVALNGAQDNGEAYINQAIENGASLIISQNPDIKYPVKYSVPIEYAANARLEYARLAAQIYQPQPQDIYAITGTNGKSSMVHFARELWRLNREFGASIGTLGIFLSQDAPNLTFSSALTTPDSGLLAKNLQKLAQNNIQKIAIEASSHGLAQFRLDGLTIKAAAMGELSQDHLDFHGTIANYYHAKMRLFRELLRTGGRAVFLQNCPIYQELKSCVKNRDLDEFTIGYDSKSRVYITEFQPLPNGSICKFRFNGREYQINFSLNGQFQCENFLTALFLIGGSEFETYLPYISQIPAVPGRLEYITDIQGAHYFVDYAHTTDALATALIALKKHLPAGNKLIVVFGCGGNRDASKRPKMGEVADKIADICIITDDNPRFEDPALIRRAILDSCPSGIEISLRSDAIHHAKKLSQAGDIILVAGKGHEIGQEIQGITTPYNDKEAILLLGDF